MPPPSTRRPARRDARAAAAALAAFLAVAGGAFVAPALAQHAHGGSRGAASSQPYAGQQRREIKSLSADDLAALRRGAGWAMAIPAELNGVPGPTHLLELRDEIGLDEEQVAAITAVRDRMREGAIAAGERFIEAERALDAAFAEGVPSADDLARLVREAGEARTALRLVHLSAHLETPPVLRPEQTARYNALRGYAPDPCANVPEGHDPTMWRRHNGCAD